MKKKTLLFVVIGLVAVGAVLGLTVFKNGRNGKTTYRTEVIGKGDIESLVVTSGTLNPMEIVDVGSQVSGKVVTLNADFNSQVAKGQVVAELDQEPLLMRIEQNEANYNSRVAALERSKVNLQTAEKKFERAKALFEKELISIEEMDTAEAAYLGAKTDLITSEASLAQAKSTLDLSKVDLSYSIIRSPVDGVVISRKINIGQTVQASYQAPVLFQIATDLTKMKVECSVDEADIGQVEEGQKVRFTVEAYPSDNFLGEVTQVRYSPETVQNVVTYTTIVNVENPEKKLRPGMTATVSIIAGEARGVLRVPNAALRYTPNLSEDKLAALMKETMDQMAAQRPGAAGGNGPGAGQEGQAAPAATPRQGERGQGERGQMLRQLARGEGGFQGQGGARRGGQPMSRVWLQDAAGGLRMVFVRTGVTDNSYSALLGGQLKEGDVVLLGELSAQSASQNRNQQSGPPRGMMFMR